MDEKTIRLQVIEEQLAGWRVNLERTRVQNKVADALKDEDMKKRVEQEATRCIIAIECLEEMAKEAGNG